MRSPDQLVTLLAGTIYADEDAEMDFETYTSIRSRADQTRKRHSGKTDDPPITKMELVQTQGRSKPTKAPGRDVFTGDTCYIAIYAEIELLLAILDRYLAYRLELLPIMGKTVLSDIRPLDLIRNPGTLHPLATHIHRNIRELEGWSKAPRLLLETAHNGEPEGQAREGTVQRWKKEHTDDSTATAIRNFTYGTPRAHRIPKNLEETIIWAQTLMGHDGYVVFLNNIKPKLKLERNLKTQIKIKLKLRFKTSNRAACVCNPERSEIKHLLLECPRRNHDRCGLETSTSITLDEMTIAETMAVINSRPHLERCCLAELKLELIKEKLYLLITSQQRRRKCTCKIKKDN